MCDQVPFSTNFCAERMSLDMIVACGILHGSVLYFALLPLQNIETYFLLSSLGSPDGRTFDTRFSWEIASRGS
jgi:hypothetical protein